MDEEETAGYREPCAQCSAVNWGVSDEGRFYCRSCHNVIERTREVVDPNFTPGSSRISTIGKGTRNKRTERGRLWMVCEGFQFILMKQADTLLRLGVRTQFKDEVLCELWRLYLQKSHQAFTHTPVRSSQFKVRRPGSDSESGPDSSVMTASETDGETNLPSSAASSVDSFTDGSICSGSVDAASYLSPRLRRKRSNLLRMRKTLALIHIALTWSREPLTLSDLLRLVKDGYVPYVNAYEDLPEEMRLEGKDALIFRVSSIPSYQVVHAEAQTLLQFLMLPAFPPIGHQSLLHPALLSLRYLTDANLPDDLYPWLCRIIESANMADQVLHTANPLSRPVLPQYDLQAAALIIVTMKLVFGLDDQTEWDLSYKAGDKVNTGDVFSLRRWFRLLQSALNRRQEESERDMARKQWQSKKPLYMNKVDKFVVTKSKRIAEQVQLCFEKLSSCPASAERPASPSSFRFCWGDEEGADGPSMHHMKLDQATTLKDSVLTLSNPSYWHPVLRQCRPSCGSHYAEMEPTLPRMFVWLLQLFAFLLDVEPANMYEETLRVERRLLKAKTQRSKATRTRKPTSNKAGGKAQSRTPRRK